MAPRGGGTATLARGAIDKFSSAYGKYRVGKYSRPRGMKLRGKQAVRVFHSWMNARRMGSFVRENEEPRAVVTRE